MTRFIEDIEEFGIPPRVAPVSQSNGFFPLVARLTLFRLLFPVETDEENAEPFLLQRIEPTHIIAPYPQQGQPVRC